MMCMEIKTFHISVIAPNATIVIYGILFGGMHPLQYICFNFQNMLATLVMQKTQNREKLNRTELYSWLTSSSNDTKSAVSLIQV